jgi:hypothetical protein
MSIPKNNVNVHTHTHTKPSNFYHKLNKSIMYSAIHLKWASYEVCIITANTFLMSADLNITGRSLIISSTLWPFFFILLIYSLLQVLSIKSVTFIACQWHIPNCSIYNTQSSSADSTVSGDLQPYLRLSAPMKQQLYSFFMVYTQSIVHTILTSCIAVTTSAPTLCNTLVVYHELSDLTIQQLTPPSNS